MDLGHFLLAVIVMLILWQSKPRIPPNIYKPGLKQTPQTWRPQLQGTSEFPELPANITQSGGGPSDQAGGGLSNQLGGDFFFFLFLLAYWASLGTWAGTLHKQGLPLVAEVQRTTLLTLRLPSVPDIAPTKPCLCLWLWGPNLFLFLLRLLLGPRPQLGFLVLWPSWTHTVGKGWRSYSGIHLD